MKEDPSSEELLEDLSRAGDMVAEVLGHCVASLSVGRPMSRDQVRAARRSILFWHRIKYCVKSGKSPYGDARRRRDG